MSRTIIVDSEVSFEDLHIYINKIFWLDGNHLYDFKYKDEFFINMPKEESKFTLWVSLLEEQKIEEYEDDIDLPLLKNYEANKTKLSDIFVNIDQIDYLYDFTNYRDFEISLVQKIVDDNMQVPKLIAAEWWYLVEDCWWPAGYNDLLEMIAKKKYDDDLFESEEDFTETIKPILTKVVLDK